MLNDGGHQKGTNPYFIAKVLDQNMVPLDSTIITLGINDTAIKPSYTNNYPLSGIYYRKWDKKTIDFTAPTYSNVTTAYLQFTVGYCCYGAHFAYAYIDAQCTDLFTTCPLSVSTNNSIQNNIQLYPNPASNFIYINSNTPLDSFEIIDITGVCVLKDKIDPKKPFTISLEQIDADGLYFLNLKTTNNESIYKKFIIRK